MKTIDLKNNEDARKLIEIYLPRDKNKFLNNEEYQILINSKTADLMVMAKKYEDEIIEMSGKNPKKAIEMIEDGHIKIFNRFLTENKK